MEKMKKIIIILSCFMLSCAGSINYLKGNTLLSIKDKSINKYDSNGYTPLMAAVRLNNYELVAKLIKGGADVNKTKQNKSILNFNIEDRPDTNTALIILVYEMSLNDEFLNQAKELKAECLENGDCSIYDDDINFYKAQELSFNNIFDLLLSTNVDVNIVNCNKRSVIFFTKNKVILEKLISKGANIDLQDVEGNSVLMCADNTELIKFLLSKGVNTKITNNDNESIVDIINKSDIVDKDSLINLIIKNRNEK